MARFYKVLIGLIILILSASFGIWQSYQSAINTEVVSKPFVFEIGKGDTFAKITDNLIAQGVAVDPFWFKAAAYHHKIANKLKVGEYDLPEKSTASDILTIFAEGRSKKYSITFPEGKNFKEILAELQGTTGLELTLPGMTPDGIAQALGIPNQHPEGWLFPDTYYFEKHDQDLSILKRAYDKMQSVLNEEWQNKAADLPYKTPYDALIMASIVEKETGAAQERPKIAGVFIRRLAIGMLLQTDPTVIYGMGDKYKGNIRASDLTTPTPYNTYVISGLPPTPIAMPGRDAIHAALHPAKDDKLYFVAKGDGSHQFSSTLSEHNHAVNIFQKHKK